MSTFDEMWAALSAHKPRPKYAKAWRRMCRKRNAYAAWDAWEAAAAAKATDAAEAAWLARAAAEAAEAVAAAAARVDQYSELAIDAMRGIKP